MFLKLVTDDGIEGVGEVYAATFGPHTVARDDRGRVRAPRRWARSLSHRGALARRLRPRLLAAAGHLARGRAERDRDGLLGHRRQGARAGPSTTCSAAGCTSACAPTPTCIPTKPKATPRRADVYLDPELAAERAAEYVRAGLHGGEVRSGRPLLDVRPAPAEPGAARALGALLPSGARGGRRPLRPAVRHARPVHGLGRDPPRAAARALRPAVVRGADAARRCPRRWRASPARPSIPIATGERLDHEVRVRARARERAPPRSCR